MEEDEMVLPALPWRRHLSRFRNVWRIRDGETIVAVVDEIGDVRSWILYWFCYDEWIVLIELGSQDSPVEGVWPRFGEIVEYAAATDLSYTWLMVRESDNGTIWWLLYCRLRVGTYHLCCAFQSRWVDVKVERMNSDFGDDTDDDDSSEFEQLIFDN
jgi:hypothetical protein